MYLIWLTHINPKKKRDQKAKIFINSNIGVYTKGCCIEDVLYIHNDRNPMKYGKTLLLYSSNVSYIGT